jgi:hypothetical protein
MKENKIIKYGLEAEVDSMLDQDMSLADTAEAVKMNHPEIEDLSDLSSMSIMRYRNSRDQLNMIKTDEEGGDSVGIFLKEFNSSIRELMRKNEKWDDRIEKLWQECKDDGTILDKVKIIKEARDNREQSKKEWTALAQYGVRQVSSITNINVKKEQNIKIMLLNWSKDLCPLCRSKVSKYLTLDAEEEKEGYAEN